MYRVGAYCRLSKEDGDKNRSNSIENQIDLIKQYVHNYDNMEIVDFFIDDGYSGLNANRPGLKSLMAAIDRKAVNTVITKDTSRLGRDHLETGNYIEKIFPLKKIRYISILDGLDTLTGSNTEMVPFKNLIDEMYAKDISKKVKGSFDAKRFKGQFIGAFAPYGYKKDINNKNLLVIDAEAAATVQLIFNLFTSGTHKSAIAKYLNDLKIPSPSKYKQMKGFKYYNPSNKHLDCQWSSASISKILSNPVYIGNLHQKKSETVFKTNGKKIPVEKNKQIICKNTHQPVIETDNFNQVQILLSQNTRKNKKTEKISLYAGMLVCADCGKNMSKCTYNNKIYYKCNTYKTKGKAYCTAHTIRENILNEAIIFMLKEISKTCYTKEDMANLKGKLTNKKKRCIKDIKYERISKIEKNKKHLIELYSEKIIGKKDLINMINDYNNELNELKTCIQNTDYQFNKENNYLLNFIELANIPFITREILIALIENIEVYENKKISVNFKFHK